MNNIYIMDYCDDHNWVYDTAQNSWEKIPGLNGQRYSSSCEVFQGQCVVIGGINDDIEDCVKSVESYDHYLKKWSFLPNLQDARYGAGVATKGNKLYVIGGCNYNSKPVNTLEVYDSLSERFTFIANTLRDIYNHHTFIDKNTIVTLECFDFWIYDIEKNTWRCHKNDYSAYCGSFAKLHKLLV